MAQAKSKGTRRTEKVDKKMKEKLKGVGGTSLDPVLPSPRPLHGASARSRLSESTAWNMVHSNRISELHCIPLLFIHNHLVNKTEKKQQNKAKNRASVIARLIREA